MTEEANYINKSIIIFYLVLNFQYPTKKDMMNKFPNLLVV